MGELLNNVRIASPCSADWEKMVGDERVRHCNQCNLNVYNLSALSSLEAHDLLAKCEGRLCVRFYHRKDGTILTRNCPVGLKIVMRRVSRVAGIALSAAMSAVPLAAQSATQSQAHTIQADSGLEIQVVDVNDDTPGRKCGTCRLKRRDRSKSDYRKRWYRAADESFSKRAYAHHILS